MVKRKVVLLVILISVLLCSFTVAYADEDIYVEDFTGHPLAVPPAGYTINSFAGTGAADVLVMDADPVLHEAIRFTMFAFDAAVMAEANRPIVINEPLVTFEFSYMGSILAPGMSGGSYIIIDDGNDYCGIMFLIDDGMAYALHDGSPILIGPYVQNAYNTYRLEIDYDAGTFDVYYNGFAIAGAQGLTLDATGVASQLHMSSVVSTFPFVHTGHFDNISITSTTAEPAPNPRTGDTISYDFIYVLAAVLIMSIAGYIVRRKVAASEI